MKHDAIAHLRIVSFDAPIFYYPDSDQARHVRNKVYALPDTRDKLARV